MENHAYWIHKKIADESALNGYFYSRECTCSECGKEVNMEKKDVHIVVQSWIRRNLKRINLFNNPLVLN